MARRSSPVAMDSRRRGSPMSRQRRRPAPEALRHVATLRSAYSWLSSKKLVQRHAGDADHLAPALILIGDEGGKIRNRLRLRLAAQALWVVLQFPRAPA